MHLTFTTAEGMESADPLKADLVVLVIERAEVESLCVGSAVDRLMTLSDSRAYTERLAGRLVILFDGYEADPRELHDIEPVVRYAQQLHEAWGFMAAFASTEFETMSLFMALLTAVPGDPTVRSGDFVGRAVTEQMATAAVVSLERGLRSLHRAHDILPSLTEACVKRMRSCWHPLD
jgi:hypothetical protein